MIPAKIHSVYIQILAYIVIYALAMIAVRHALKKILSAGYEGFFKNTSSICVDTCPINYIPDVTNRVCTAKPPTSCIDDCEACPEEDPNRCILCKEGFFKNAENICVDTCPVGFLPDATNRVCMAFLLR